MSYPLQNNSNNNGSNNNDIVSRLLKPYAPKLSQPYIFTINILYIAFHANPSNADRAIHMRKIIKTKKHKKPHRHKNSVNVMSYNKQLI